MLASLIWRDAGMKLFARFLASTWHYSNKNHAPYKINRETKWASLVHQHQNLDDRFSRRFGEDL